MSTRVLTFYDSYGLIRTPYPVEQAIDLFVVRRMHGPCRVAAFRLSVDGLWHRCVSQRMSAYLNFAIKAGCHENPKPRHSRPMHENQALPDLGVERFTEPYAKGGRWMAVIRRLTGQFIESPAIFTSVCRGMIVHLPRPWLVRFDHDMRDRASVLGEEAQQPELMLGYVPHIIAPHSRCSSFSK